ncbi:MAG: hypothetical protein L6416_05940, partial [Candidatus Omnitrophica bacterium]|nr:hypothetical protein [Candidatus Omnitrophota bacterium]
MTSINSKLLYFYVPYFFSFYPIEVKWTKQFRTVDIKQIQHYKKGIILTSDSKNKVLGSNHIIPLLRFLIHISGG